MVALEGKFFYNLKASSLLEMAFFGANFNYKFVFSKHIPTLQKAMVLIDFFLVSTYAT